MNSREEKNINLEYFEILGVAANASKEAIRKAYKAAALKFHPDKNPSAEATDKFRKICEAYKVLCENKTVLSPKVFDQKSELFNKKLTEVISKIKTNLRKIKIGEYQIQDSGIIEIGDMVGLIARNTDTDISILILCDLDGKVNFEYDFPSDSWFITIRHAYDNKIVISLRENDHYCTKILEILDGKLSEINTFDQKFFYLFGPYIVQEAKKVDPMFSVEIIIDVSQNPNVTLGILPVKDKEKYTGKFLAASPAHNQIAVKSAKNESRGQSAELCFWNINNETKEFQLAGEIKTNFNILSGFYCGDYFILQGSATFGTINIECWSLKNFERLVENSYEGMFSHGCFQAFPHGLGFASLDNFYLHVWNLNTLTPKLLIQEPVDCFKLSNRFIAYIRKSDPSIKILPLKGTLPTLQSNPLLLCSSNMWQPSKDEEKFQHLTHNTSVLDKMISAQKRPL